MYTNSGNASILIGYETDDIIDELFKSILERYQKRLEESIRGSEFVYKSIDLLHYRLHKISLNRGGSYIASPKWLKNKKTTINPKNNDGKYFQYAITSALNYQNIKNNPQEIYNIIPYIKQYNWNEMEFPSHKKDWNKSEKSNETIALNVLFVPYNTKQIRQTYISKHDGDREKQVILLMITNSKKWHYLFVKRLCTLLKRITSKHVGDFYCLNCLHSYRTKNALKKHEKVCNNHDYCYIEIPKEDNKILKYYHSEKSMKVPFIIYADLESLLEKISNCHNNPQ